MKNNKVTNLKSIVIDSDLILNENLTIVDMRVYLLIKSQCLVNDIYMTKTSLLSKTLNFSQRAIQISLKRLEDEGLIVCEQAKPFYKIYTTQ
ncbi:hypothetical protein YTPLAS21_19460 [Candidatus Nitrosocosmicus sp.]|nr:hypothetical protein YTPLAS21_19460 [Candidatus Nitrosocosmicus sp.]